MTTVLIAFRSTSSVAKTASMTPRTAKTGPAAALIEEASVRNYKYITMPV